MRVCFKNFTGGECAPSVRARYDLDKYANSVAEMTNFLPGLHGDVQRRPGTLYVADLERKSVLIPFSFSSEKAQNFVLVFSDKLLRVAVEEALFLDTNITTPYAESELYELSYAQSGDVVYIAHKNHVLRKVVRRGSSSAGYTWALETVEINKGLPAPNKPTVTFERNNADDDAELGFRLRYKITAVDAEGHESLASLAGGVNGKHPSDWVKGNRVKLTWAGVVNAVEFNVYREEAGYYGFIGVKQNTLISGIRYGNSVSNIIKYAATQKNVVTIANGNPDVTDGREDGTVNVVANKNQNAFWVDRNLFVLSTITTETVTWNLNGDQWTSSKTIETEKKWCMLRAIAENSIAGNYTPELLVDGGNLGTDTVAPDGDINGVSVSPVYGSNGTLTFYDNNFEADTSITPQEDWQPFRAGNNPATVTFHQQRMVLAGTAKEPATFYMSRTGDYENFRKSRPLQDDDPVEYMVASGSIDAISWATSFSDLLIGTAGAEYKVTAEDVAITPKTVGISTQSFWGSAQLPPLVIGNSVLHSQRFGGHVRDLFYSLEKDGYSGNDLSILSPHLFEGHRILQWCYQQSPGSNVWSVRDDGVLLCMTYLKEHNIYGWSKHITEGKVLSVCTISGAQSDVVMCVVERQINGQARYFLERLTEQRRDDDDIKDAFFVDCGKIDFYNKPRTTIYGLDYLEGASVSVLADGSPVENLTVTNGSITLPFDASKVHVGLPYTSSLQLLPVEADMQNGSSLGKKRGYGKAVVRFIGSVGGKYGAEVGEMFDIPFVPEVWGEACVPYTGDIELIVPGGQATNTSLRLVQDRPLPMHIIAVAIDVDFAEV